MWIESKLNSGHYQPLKFTLPGGEGEGVVVVMVLLLLLVELLVVVVLEWLIGVLRYLSFQLSR